MQKLKVTYSKWGNLYKNRFFLDGKRISEKEAKTLLDSEDTIYIDSGDGPNRFMAYDFHEIYQVNKD